MIQANDLCWDMHEQSDSYAWAEDYLGWTVAEYGNPEDGAVINHQTTPCV